MGIFKTKILDGFLQDETLLKKRFRHLQSYQAKADDIKTFKEAEYQDGFLREIFEDCLGYTLNITEKQ